MAYEITKSEEEWRKILSPEAFKVLRKHGTEYAARVRSTRITRRGRTAARAATCPCSPRRRNSTAAPAGRASGSRSTTRSAPPSTASSSRRAPRSTAAAAAAPRPRVRGRAAAHGPALLHERGRHEIRAQGGELIRQHVTGRAVPLHPWKGIRPCCASSPPWPLLPRLALATAPRAQDTRPLGRIGVATFGSGCFWCTEADFDKIPGVLHHHLGLHGRQDAEPELRAGRYRPHRTCRGAAADLRQIQVGYEQLLDHYWRDRRARRHRPVLRPRQPVSAAIFTARPSS